MSRADFHESRPATMNETTLYAEHVDRIRDDESAFVYEQHDQGKVVLSGKTRALRLRSGSIDPYHAIDAFLKRWQAMLRAEDLPVAHVMLFIGYETQAADHTSKRLPESETPSLLLLVPRSLSIIDTTNSSVTDADLPWSDFLLGTDFKLTNGHEDEIHQIRGSVEKSVYLQRVTAVQELIRQGEVEQVVVSMSRDFENPPAVEDLFMALRRLNPSPQMFMLKIPGFSIAGSTPLRMFELNGRQIKVETDGGTRPVDQDQTTDTPDWAPSEKEVNEHELLVTALNEDLAPLLEEGSLNSGGSLQERNFSHVRHLFAEATGTIRADVSVGDVFRGMAPHGAVTGAPKGRSIEAIAEIEGTARGAYGGVIGLIGPAQTVDVACVIRSFVTVNDTLTVQTGAGIVELSDPEAEYQECLDKAQALIDVVASFRVGK